MRISDWSSDVCSSDLGRQVLTFIRDWASGLITSFTNFQVRIITGVIGWVARLIGRFLALRDRAIANVRGLWSVAGSLFRLGVRTVATTARNGLNNVTGFFRDLPGRIGNALATLGSLSFNPGRPVDPGPPHRP